MADIKKATRFHIIKKKSDVDRLIAACKATGYCSYDFEANSNKIYSSDFYPTLLGVSFQPGSSIIIPLNHFESPFKSKWKRILRKFGREVIENPNIVKIGWNLKFDSQIFMKYGIFQQGRIFDGMLAKYLLDEERPSDLKSMVWRFFPQYAGYEENYPGCKLPWAERPLEGLSQYCAIDTDMSFRLMLYFESKLIKLGFYNLFRSLYMPASRTVTAMERHGMKLDVPFNDALKEKYAQKLIDVDKKLRSIKKIRKFEKALQRDRIEAYINKVELEIKEIKQERKIANKNRDTKALNSCEKKIKSREQKIARVLAGEYGNNDERKLIEPLNIASTQQMVQLFFTHPEGFKFKVVKYTKKDKKETTNPSTAEDVLKELRHKDKTGFIDILLEFRGLQTINSTFIIGIREVLAEDGMIHPRFLLHGTVTGRYSSSDPNFQNLPRPATNPDIKRMMIPNKGKLFFMMDYSQAELRILAHMAKEETMLEWFRTGKDIHLASACKKYNEDYGKIYAIMQDELHPRYKEWKVKRKQAKTINFGIVYEQSAKKLSESLSNPEEGIIVSIKDAQVFLDEFYKDFPKILRFQKKQHKYCEKHGYVYNLFGMKRRLPNVYSDDYSKYLEALRQSTNAPVQGSASLMAAFASVLIRQAVLKGELPWMDGNTTVHDSLVYELEPKGINIKTVYTMWDIARNPETKKYFGFKIDDVEMAMDFSVGRTYDEELPFIPGYDYNKLLDSNWKKEEYFKEYEKYQNLAIHDYKVKFPEAFKKVA